MKSNETAGDDLYQNVRVFFATNFLFLSYCVGNVNIFAFRRSTLNNQFVAISYRSIKNAAGVSVLLPHSNPNKANS